MIGEMNELALFAGAGGGLLASRLLGWSTVGAVEIERYPREALLQRQRDGMLDQFPIWDDVRTFDGKPWRGLVDVVSGGFPCQDISSAGKGAGLAGARSGLWFEYLRIVEEIRPRFVFAENSPNLRTRGLGTIIEGLASLGYGVRWGVLGAWHLGAPHKRNRMWLVADSGSFGHGNTQKELRTGRYSVEYGGGKVSNANGSGCEEQRWAIADETQHPALECGGWWESEPAVGRVAHGVADRVDRLKAIGNGQVPIVAASAFRVLSGGAA